jgi:hypothetical protein
MHFQGDVGFLCLNGQIRKTRDPISDEKKFRTCEFGPLRRGMGREKESMRWRSYQRLHIRRLEPHSPTGTWRESTVNQRSVLHQDRTPSDSMTVLGLVASSQPAIRKKNAEPSFLGTTILHAPSFWIRLLFTRTPFLRSETEEIPWSRKSWTAVWGTSFRSLHEFRSSVNCGLDSEYASGHTASGSCVHAHRLCLET